MRLVACALAACVTSASVAEAQGTFPVACRPETPIASLGSTVSLQAFVPATHAKNATYRWRVSGGEIAGEGAKASWTLPTTQPDSYSATVDVTAPPRVGTACEMRVYAIAAAGQRGPEVRRRFLVGAEQEEKGLHLYSYLLFGSPPADDRTRQRYLAALRAYVSILPMPDDLVAVPVNVAMTPLTAMPPTNPPPSPDWLLEHYSWERARKLLRLLDGDRLDGPYIVSSRQPLGTIAELKTDYLFQDLTRVPPDLVNAWVREFIFQSMQEQFWKERTGPALALKMRTVVGVLASGLPDIDALLTGLIVWR